MFLAKVVLLIAIAKLTVSEVTSNRTKVSVYHESLCPGCQSFITTQLYPVYQKVGDVFELEMVPYGWTTQTRDIYGNLKFICQHGENECKGNKYEACAIDQKKEQKVEIEFLNCIILNSPYDEEQVKACATEGNYDWSTLSSCFEGERSTELILEYGEKTNSLTPEMPYVPFVIFNDIFDYDKNDMALEDFLKALCSELPSPKPEACHRNTNKKCYSL